MSTTAGTLPSGDVAATKAADDRMYSKITWHILPLLFICYLFNYMDRTNIGFAQLQMKDQLQFSDQIFAIGAGIFFVSYALCEVPSNLLLARWGFRNLMLRIMVLWGLASACMMFVSTPTQFYVLRFILGMFEAGFVPGVLYYFTLWYPSERRASVVALFIAAFVTGPMVSGPLAGFILQHMDQLGGLRGWQWLFIVEGLPSAALGVVCYLYLSDKPQDAKWLTDAEKKRVEQLLAEDAAKHGQAGHHGGLLEALSNPRVWLFGIIYFLCLVGSFALAFWQPTILRGMGLSYWQIGVASAVPPIVSIIFMILLGRSSDRMMERRWHFTLAALMGAAGLAATTLFMQNPVMAVICLAIGHAGIASAVPIFWTVPPTILSRSAAAGGIAMISTIGVFAGAVSPYMVAYIRGLTGEFIYSLYFMALGLLLAAILLITFVTPKMLVGSKKPA